MLWDISAYFSATTYSDAMELWRQLQWLLATTGVVWFTFTYNKSCMQNATSHYLSGCVESIKHSPESLYSKVSGIQTSQAMVEVRISRHVLLCTSLDVFNTSECYNFCLSYSRNYYVVVDGISRDKLVDCFTEVSFLNKSSSILHFIGLLPYSVSRPQTGHHRNGQNNSAVALDNH